MGSHEVGAMKQQAKRMGMADVVLVSLLAGVAVGQVALAGQAAPAAGGAQGQKEVRPAIQWQRFDYACGGGAKLTVYLHDPTAKVEYKGQQYLMRRTKSADGVRYSDGKVVWWSRSNGGFLQQDTPDWNGKMMVKDCKLAKPSSKAESKKP
jgi:membrane-bound inhibitor of C-type lysozyme